MTRSFRFNLLALAIASCFGAAHANPTGGQVVSGQATMVNSGNLLTVTNSANAIINWQTFSIGRNETTRFVQPSASSAVLNRVLGNNPSELLGQLQSNGRVFLINPAGILVGKDAVIDVAGLVASTLNLSDSNFLAGKQKFDQTPGAAAVHNAGTIRTADGGQVYLVAPKVNNSGSIAAADGTVVLAAGERVEIGDTALPGLKVEVVGAGEASNVGELLAASGKVGIVGALVRNSGKVDVSAIEREGGRIFLRAARKATVDGGELLATGARGGRISVEGEEVDIAAGLLDASGEQAGGQVLVGGGYQGRNSEVRNATRTRFGSAAEIRADATENGNGGEVVVWSDDTTLAAGRISARAGTLGGDGGLVEVSGKSHLVFRAQVDTRAPAGKTGTLLLDPSDVTIASRGDRAVTTVDGQFDTAYAVAGASESSAFTLYWEDLVSQLGQNNVVVQTSSAASGAGNIDVVDGQTFASGNQLSLLAENNLTVHTGADVVNTGNGGFQFVAGWNPTSGTSAPLANNGTTTGTMLINGGLQTQGQINLSSKGDTTLNGLVKSTAGPVVLTVGGNLEINLPSTAELQYVDDAYFEYRFPSGYQFGFYGKSYDRAYISSNGVISFGKTEVSPNVYVENGVSEFSDSIRALGALKVPVIAAAWNDWEINASQGESIQITRPSGNELAVKWDVGRYSRSGNKAVFETVLNRQNGNITFNYGATSTESNAAVHPSFAGDVTIGLARGDGTTQISGLMGQEGFSMHNLKSTTFRPSANGYTETIANSGGQLASRGAVVYSSNNGFAFKNTNISSYTTLQAATQLVLNVGGQIRGEGGIVAPSLAINAGQGVMLEYGLYNQVGLLTANVRSGGLSFQNHNLSAPGDFEFRSAEVGGDIYVSNFGATVIGTAAPGIRASGGISVAANSPLTVGTFGVTSTGTGNISLAANNNGALTLTGPVRTGGTINLFGGSVTGADVFAPGACINGQACQTGPDPAVVSQAQSQQNTLISSISGGTPVPSPSVGGSTVTGSFVPASYFSPQPGLQPGLTLPGGTTGGGNNEFGGPLVNTGDFLFLDDNYGQNAFAARRVSQCN